LSIIVYTFYMVKKILTNITLFALLLTVAIMPIFAEEVDDVGKNTEKIIENVSSQKRPAAVEVNTQDCGLFKLKCIVDKADFVHKDSLPKAKIEEEEKLNIVESVIDLFAKLFKKSAEKDTAYSYTYLPKNVEAIPETGSGEGGMSNKEKAEAAHKTVNKSLLPYKLQTENNLGSASNLAFTNSVPTAIVEEEPIEDLGKGTDDTGKITYFAQIDPTWKSIEGRAYCDDNKKVKETIGNSGCGPTSVAMLVNSKNSSIGPVQLWNEYVNNKDTYCGTMLIDHSAYLKKYGYVSKGIETCKDISQSECLSNMTKFANAKPVGERFLVVMAYLRKNDTGECKKGGHFFVVTGFENGEPQIYDPHYGYKKSVPISASSLNYQCQNYKMYLIVDK
jgi:hypothetical protein